MAEIIDEIIEACHCITDKYNDTVVTIIDKENTSEHSIDSNNECLSDDGIKFCVQSEHAERQDKDITNDHGGEFYDEMDIIDQLEAMDIEQTGDVSKVAVDDNNSGIRHCENGTELEDEAIKTMDIHRSSDDLQSKGFSTSVYGQNMRVVVNLPLMAVGSKYSQYEVQCEGFPTRMMEDELVPLFEKFGQLYRLVMLPHINEIHVTYVNVEDVDKAVTSLHHSNVQGRKIKVFKALPKGQLIVRHIPKSATKAELLDKFRSITAELQDVQLYNDEYNESRNRGFCYLDYGDHLKANKAMKRLKQMFGAPVHVEWPSRQYRRVQSSDTLFISNLRSSLGCDDLKMLFSPYGKLMDVYRTGTFGKVRFQKPEDAIRAASEVDKKQLGNENVEISLAALSEKRDLGLPITSYSNKTKLQGSLAAFSKKLEPKTDLCSTSTLYISNVSSSLTSKDLREIFSQYGDVIEIDKNEDFASVRFRLPEQSSRALRLINRNQLGHNVQITVDKHPETIRRNDVPADTLFLKNLRPDINTSDIRECFSIYGEVLAIDKNDDTASVHFRNPDIAKHAARGIDKYRLGKNVQISFAKVADAEHGKQKKLPVVSDTLYISNMNANTSIFTLRTIFTHYGKVTEIERNGNRASVQFSNVEDSKRAAHQVNRKDLGEGNVKISFFP